MENAEKGGARRKNKRIDYSAQKNTFIRHLENKHPNE
jgi:hypothetical protein